MNRLVFGIIVFISFLNFSCTKTKAPAPCGPVPSENQMQWQEMEYYAFVHYSLNTYTDQSWGFGNEDVKLFNSEKADCRQWARICKEAGMKGIIITAKHHCGFCLWPSKYTEYSVKNVQHCSQPVRGVPVAIVRLQVVRTDEPGLPKWIQPERLDFGKWREKEILIYYDRIL